MSFLHIENHRTSLFLTKAYMRLKYHIRPFYYCNPRKSGKRKQAWVTY
jgi:hypothetical protein